MLRNYLVTPIGKISFVLVLVVVFVLTASWYMRPRPEERNRVIAPAGYSIIRPEGWSAEMRAVFPSTSNSGEAVVRDVVTISPDRFLGIAPKLSVRHFTIPPNLDALRAAGQWSSGTFQNETALIFDHKVKRSLIRGALIERAGQWFELAENLPNAEAIRADQWWGFLETFRYPEPGAPLPTTMTAVPATTPSTEAFSLPFSTPGVDAGSDQ